MDLVKRWWGPRVSEEEKFAVFILLVVAAIMIYYALN